MIPRGDLEHRRVVWLSLNDCRLESIWGYSQYRLQPTHDIRSSDPKPCPCLFLSLNVTLFRYRIRIPDDSGVPLDDRLFILTLACKRLY